VRGKNAHDDGVFLGFETVTMCPFDRNLIDAALLNPTNGSG
jgi:hypothetical protein